MSKDNVRGDEEVLSKKDHIVNYAKALDAVESEMEPFREHKRALKESYIENGWLSKEELSMVLRVYRANKNQLDIEQFNDIWHQMYG